MRTVAKVCLLGVAALTVPSASAQAAEIRFEINDAHVKDKPVAGVTILVATAPGADAEVTGETDESGAARLDLDPGTYWVSYVRSGYVPIGDSETVIRGDGQVVTTTMSMLLEAEGSVAGRRIRIVLNWGSEPSNVRDADAHAYCVCSESDAHVYFASMRHDYAGHVVELDVDDREWGGPETVTLSDPGPGAYRYWVHQYSQDEDGLGPSDVVVRVFFDDSMAGEFRIPPTWDLRTWKPFRRIEVGADLQPTLVGWTAADLAAGSDAEPPPDRLPEESAADSQSFAVGCSLAVLAIIGIVVFVGLVARRRRR